MRNGGRAGHHPRCPPGTAPEAEGPLRGRGGKGKSMTEARTGQDAVQAGSPLRTPRAAAVAGILFSVLLITALTLLRLSAPRSPATAGIWLTNSANRTTVAIGLNLVPFAGIAFLWFMGVLRDRIGERED